MRQDGKRSGRPWRRQSSKPGRSVDPVEVFQELQRRQLADLEDCRTAWERGGDPLGLCVAVTKVDLPDWLADALLVILTDQSEGPTRGWMTQLLRQHWRATHKDAVDAVRDQRRHGEARFVYHGEQHNVTSGAGVTVDDVLPRLDHVRATGRGSSARCPAHQDQSPSLSVAIGRGGQLLLFCHAG